ncbi:DUF6879 family protein [Streptomyces decoyicus]|uniref:DUF6879 family protein n=1 Tax=Streptomyces decoyicus TaxID=249567 RepID=UPI00363E0394
MGLPDYDFWLLDSRTGVKFSFDDEENMLGVEIIEDPATVLAACQTRDAAWHYAVPTIEFQTQLPSTV